MINKGFYSFICCYPYQDDHPRENQRTLVNSKAQSPHAAPSLTSLAALWGKHQLESLWVSACTHQGPRRKPQGPGMRYSLGCQWAGLAARAEGKKLSQRKHLRYHESRLTEVRNASLPMPMYTHTHTPLGPLPRNHQPLPMPPPQARTLPDRSAAQEPLEGGSTGAIGSDLPSLILGTAEHTLDVGVSVNKQQQEP